MKIKLLHKVYRIIPFFTLIFMSLLISCPPPETETPPSSGPAATLTMDYYSDPYVVTNKPFSLCINIDILQGTLGEYNISLSYDTTLMELNESLNDGVEPGIDGFITSADTTTPGIIHISGNDETGIGPGAHLQLILCHFIAKGIGQAAVALDVTGLTTTNFVPFEVDDSAGFTVSIELPEFYSLTGQVLDGIGGSPVENAEVTLQGTGSTVNTGADGFFTFTDILIGVYDILVTKPGRAGSKLEAVHVNGNESPVEIIQPYYNYLIDEIIPPSITIRGVIRDEEYNGIIPIDITVSPGSCPVAATEFHKSIYLKIGITEMNYYELANSSFDTLSYLWNTTLFTPGEVIIKVVAYDSNNNRSEINIPVISITGNSDYTQEDLPEVAPLEEYYSIVANTYGKSMDIMRVYPDFSQMSNQTLYSTRAPADSAILVEFSVEKYYNGIVVYRSDSEDGTYTLICQTSYINSYTYRCIDYSPSLEAGTTVYYKLAYYNKYGIGPLTEPIPVRILPTYNLSLVSPMNNSIVTETSATITWTCEPFLDAQRTDWVIATNVMDTTIVAYSFVINQTEYTLTDLLYNNIYEWDIRSYYEYTNSVGRSNVLSRSFPRGKGSYDLSLNGAFIFTVLNPD